MSSSVIRRFVYHPHQATLEIVFVSGRRYRYHDVPAALYAEMREAMSKGEFFNRYIRDHFAFEQVAD